MSVVTADRRFTGAGEDFGPRKGTLSVHLHTVENADPHKTTVRDAIALHRWQDRDDVAGSYNRIMCTDGVLRCMDDWHASGGVNPSSSFFKPNAWLFQHLPKAAVLDPNGYGVNLAAMGQKAHFDAVGWPTRIIDGFARSIIEFEDMLQAKTGKRPSLVIDNHADYQPGNRTDAGPIAIDLVMKRYRQLTATLPDTSTPSPEDTMNLVEPLLPYQTGRASFHKPDTQYDLFEVGPNPDPATYKRMTYRTPKDRGSSAPVDGPWVWTDHTWPGWWRISDGPLAGLFLSKNGPQPVITIDVPAAADCSAEKATIETQSQLIADQKTSLSAKNAALDEAIAAERAHAPIAEKLASARKA